MPKIRFYHIRTLFWTYLAWAVLNLLFAFLVLKPMPQLYMNPNTSTDYPLARVPIVWAWLHIAPLWFLITTCQHGAKDLFIMVAGPTAVAMLAVISGLLINRWWARFLIIIGMGIWFLEGFFVGASGA